MSSPVVHYELRDTIAWIKMDDGKANALNIPMFQAMKDALTRAKEEKAKAVVLTGREGMFSGGLDLKTLQELSIEGRQELLVEFRRMAGHISGFPLPIIAAVTGHSVAGGCVLMLACDYKLGIEGRFKIGLNEVAIGLAMPSFITDLAQASLALPYHIPAILHATLYPPSKAREIGYLDEVLQSEELEGRAQAYATQLAKLIQPGYAISKQRIRQKLITLNEEAYIDEVNAFLNLFG